jgi:hypothetical protein
VIFFRVFNFGNAPVSFNGRQIFASNGATVTPTFDTCGTSLGAGQTCAYAATITGAGAGALAYSCRVVDGSTSSSLSGAAEVQSSTTEVLSVLPLVH